MSLPFTSISDPARVAALPLILAGPILRRAEEKQVTVWLALKSGAQVTLSVKSTEVEGPSPSPLLSGTSHSVQVGPNLHVVAITATPLTSNPQQLLLQQIYWYMLDFDVDGAPPTINLAKAFASPLAAVDPSRFSYGEWQHPSFLLPPADLTQVRIAQGSCRKLHWRDTDSLALLDDRIAASASTLSARPQLLVLGGDQIYADEVADGLLAMLTDAAHWLIGDETMPDTAETRAADYPPQTRGVWMALHGFTSDDLVSHLMTFGEYMAMYLFAWSDVCWPATLPLPLPLYNQLIIPKAPHRPSWYEEVQTCANQLAGLNATRATLWRVRRALANIPTYMILDDHEITDDWNMMLRFCAHVYDNDSGTRIVQNGLVAYALCQHWGNAASQFGALPTDPPPPPNTPTPPGQELLGLFQAIYPAYPNNGGNQLIDGYKAIVANAASVATIQRIVGLHDGGTVAAQRKVFHEGNSFAYNYTVEGKAFQIIVTDTRTWRGFPPRARSHLPLDETVDVSNFAAPDLLTSDQVEAQITNIPIERGDRLQLVVVTTNMPPSPILRQLARDLPRDVLDHWTQFEDFFDSWDIEQQDFIRTVDAIARRVNKPVTPSNRYAGRVVLMSGDVHSSQMNRLAYWDGVASGSPTAVFVQVVASALLNGNKRTVEQTAGGYAALPWPASHIQQPLEMT